ncbi:MAG: plasmid pRiA4b ORF-3 family protein [Anaerolineales bacterium]
MASKRKPQSIHQIKITLKNIRPPIWRQLQVDSNTTLRRLHNIIQAARGWENYHLYTFTVNDAEYGVPDPDWDVESDARLRLKQFPEGAKFTYTYDMGDGWEHEIKIEQILPPEEGAQYPRCLKGKRACPPEDCGGVWGYQNLLEALANPKHPEHDMYEEWIGDDFDPDYFNLDEVNEMLKHL